MYRTNNITLVEEIQNEHKELQRQLRNLKMEQEKLKTEFNYLTSSNIYRLWQFINYIKKLFIKPLNQFIEIFLICLIKLNKFDLAIIWYKHQKQIKKYLSINDEIFHDDNRIALYKITNVKKYCLNKNLKYQVIYPKQKSKVFKPYYFGDKKKFTKNVIQPEMYVAEIKNAIICGANSLILSSDDQCLLDSTTYPESKRVDFIYGPIRYLINQKALIDIPKNKKNIESGIMMNGIASYNYYHWLLEFIPRLELINKLKKYSHIPFLVDQVCHDIPQLEESILLLKKHHQDIIFLEPNKQYHVRNLVVPSYTSWNVINLKKRITLRETDSIISSQSIKFLRSSYLLNIDKYSKSNKKIYISRLTSKNRKFNEEEIKLVFLNRGFEIIYPEELTFLEQLEIFSHAKVIAGATGAGLTNIIFAPKSAIIICLVSQPMNFTGFSNIAGLNNQNMVFLVGKPDKNTSHPYYQANFTINPDEVAHAIDTILLSKKVVLK
jgi:capsular polysaccharide biosynthesis protein